MLTHPGCAAEPETHSKGTEATPTLHRVRPPGLLPSGLEGIPMKTVLALITALVSLSPALARAGDDDRHHRFKHIFVIMMENHGTDQILGNHVDAPFINELAGHSGVAWRYYGVTHPSLPNYLALFSGSFQGIWDDCKAGPTITCGPEEFVPGSGDATDGTYLTAAQIADTSARPHWFSSKNL